MSNKDQTYINVTINNNICFGLNDDQDQIVFNIEDQKHIPDAKIIKRLVEYKFNHGLDSPNVVCNKKKFIDSLELVNRQNTPNSVVADLKFKSNECQISKFKILGLKPDGKVVNYVGTTNTLFSEAVREIRQKYKNQDGDYFLDDILLNNANSLDECGFTNYEDPEVKYFERMKKGGKKAEKTNNVDKA